DVLDLGFARKYLDVEPAILTPAGACGLVYRAHRGADPNLAEQPLDILGVHPDAAMADVAPDPVRFVGAVNQVILPAQMQRISAERVVRAGRDHRRQLGPFGPDRGRWIPGRARLLPHHAARAERRLALDDAEDARR